MKHQKWIRKLDSTQTENRWTMKKHSHVSFYFHIITMLHKCALSNGKTKKFAEKAFIFYTYAPCKLLAIINCTLNLIHHSAMLISVRQALKNARFGLIKTPGIIHMKFLFKNLVQLSELNGQTKWIALQLI